MQMLAQQKNIFVECNTTNKFRDSSLNKSCPPFCNLTILLSSGHIHLLSKVNMS